MKGLLKWVMKSEQVRLGMRRPFFTLGTGVATVNEAFCISMLGKQGVFMPYGA
ncbi:MAG: hypothetical protein KGZ70_05510 [Hydrogenophaga sp.]|uniref:hypothetical protein n=1 Tax=Hydrogenophaga sp. TaxID=1904254 RepID=UPI001BB8D7F9|nr:hypothetical protein [Hydrogenophaga sp.]MBS3911280.1 hypothetical protein [Hydrogenophaga sp.]MDO9146171.1 hypothetical protein [Hydrogenophaga sp.]MDO9605072.1 hypothetical protein [Hydrogenophaga sp.]MDP2162700.1 hypothetical protein [Hydrogenophaga sp.]MDP3477012.1 hypothetical protein [Hydrogenophaga sp.]